MLSNMTGDFSFSTTNKIGKMLIKLQLNTVYIFGVKVLKVDQKESLSKVNGSKLKKRTIAIESSFKAIIFRVAPKQISFY